MTNPPRPPVKPLTEGYVVKGGHNPGTSQIQTRPPAPAPIPSPKPAAAPTSPPAGGRGDG
jgi:hypothetical protein